MNRRDFFRCTQQLSPSSPKGGAMYCCYVQDPTRYIVAAFYRLRSVYSLESL